MAETEQFSEATSTACAFCNSNGNHTLSGVNVIFLTERATDGNLNDAIDIARIAWKQFPTLNNDPSARRTAEIVLEALQDKINSQVLAPINNTTNTMAIIIDRLEVLAEQ